MNEKKANEEADRHYQMRFDKKVEEEVSKREQYEFAEKGHNEPVSDQNTYKLEEKRSRVMSEKGLFAEYKFSEFASMHFQDDATHTFIPRPIRQSLLPLKTEGDHLAALAVWVTILRLMGDLPEPKMYMYQDINDSRVTIPVMKKISQTLDRRSNEKGTMEAQSHSLEMKRNPSVAVRVSDSEKRNTINEPHLVSLDLKKKPEPKGQLMNPDSYMTSSVSNALLQDRPTSNLEKLHFIIGHGILIPDVRDEIFCQICKQLTQNPSKASQARGWVLLSLCVGCFAASDKFIKYLRNFIHEGPPGDSLYCEERLQRTLNNGTRHQPPPWIEFQAVKAKEPLMLPVTFLDGNTKTLLADSATTARELCQQLSYGIGLKDKFGLSLNIAMFDKVSNLGSGGYHVLDAVSKYEQYAREQGVDEKDASWRLFFRKEVVPDPNEEQVPRVVLQPDLPKEVDSRKQNRLCFIQ